jgi:hypothetical protein
MLQVSTSSQLLVAHYNPSDVILRCCMQLVCADDVLLASAVSCGTRVVSPTLTAPTARMSDCFAARDASGTYLVKCRGRNQGFVVSSVPGSAIDVAALEVQPVAARRS